MREPENSWGFNDDSPRKHVYDPIPLYDINAIDFREPKMNRSNATPGTQNGIKLSTDVKTQPGLPQI